MTTCRTVGVSTIRITVACNMKENLVFMSTFNDQSMSIGCVGKLGYLSGFLRHYLLKADRPQPRNYTHSTPDYRHR